jgi:hypothetical protein
MVTVSEEERGEWRGCRGVRLRALVTEGGAGWRERFDTEMSKSCDEIE